MAVLIGWLVSLHFLAYLSGCIYFLVTWVVLDKYLFLYNKYGTIEKMNAPTRPTHPTTTKPDLKYYHFPFQGNQASKVPHGQYFQNLL